MHVIWSKHDMTMNDLPFKVYIATWLIFGYRIYSVMDIVFNDATPLLTYKATEKIKLSLVVYVS